MVELRDHARALARIPSGLFILSVGRGPTETALLVSFVQQVGFAPPAVSFALKKGRDHVLGVLRAERTFCLAVVPEDGRALLAQFSSGFAPGVDPFAGVLTATAANGVRYPTAACAHIACELVGEVDWSDHLLLCGRVTAGSAVPDAKPWVHLRKNGLSYLRVAAVVPAAGRGRRMGADKALLDLEGELAIVRVVAACRGGGADVVIVVRAKGAAALPADLPVQVVEVEPDAEMVDSVRAGLRALAPVDAVVLFPVDHALASAETVRALVRRLRTAARPAVALPLFDGRPGHPIVFPWALVSDVFDPAVQTLRDVVRRAQVEAVPVRDPWVARDLDTPEDLALARAHLRGRARGLFEVMRGHRSRRAYKTDPVAKEQIVALVDAARYASTSSFIQAYAVVAVTEPQRRAEIAGLCADQEHIRQAPLFLAICADLQKLARACRKHGTTFDSAPFETFLQATVDAALMGQNLLLAAEADGLGGCMIGAARDHPVELARLLALPPYAYVVFGMTLGYPADDPSPRGRMPLEGILFFEQYDESRLDVVLEGADAGMRAWARACNQRGGYGGRPVDERKGWTDRMATLWSKEKARPTPRLALRQRLLDLDLPLL